MKKYTFKSDKKRQYHREGRMSKAEVMMIMIFFHSSGYRCLKHFYLDRVCKHMRHLFPEVELTLRYICAVHRKDSAFYIHSLLTHNDTRRYKMKVTYMHIHGPAFGFTSYGLRFMV